MTADQTTSGQDSTMRNAVSVVLLGMGLCGCASMFSGNSDEISVNSLETGTVIYVDGMARGKDSTLVQVKRGKSHSIVAKKDGCQDTMSETSWAFDPRSLLGVLIDLGLITIPIDFAIGGAMATDPTTYTVTPVCPDQPTHADRQTPESVASTSG